MNYDKDDLWRELMNTHTNRIDYTEVNNNSEEEEYIMGVRNPNYKPKQDNTTENTKKHKYKYNEETDRYDRVVEEDNNINIDEALDKYNMFNRLYKEYGDKEYKEQADAIMNKLKEGGLKNE